MEDEERQEHEQQHDVEGHRAAEEDGVERAGEPAVVVVAQRLGEAEERPHLRRDRD